MSRTCTVFVASLLLLAPLQVLGQTLEPAATGQAAASPAAREMSRTEALNLFNSAFTQFRGTFVDQVDADKLVEAMERMRGSIGTPLKLTVQRGKGGQSFDLTLMRELVKSPAVRWRTEGTVGYVKISGFTQQTQPGLEKAMAGINVELGSLLTGYVLDLRDNPGGLVKQAISVCDSFLDQGEIVSTRGRDPESARHYSATPGDLARGKPVVLIVNGRSASASEIVAGALQDQRRAVVLGTQTFGKGSVQTITPLSNRGATRMTTARYYTPTGRSIQALGINPGMVVVQAKVTLASDHGQESDYQLTRALDIVRGAALFTAPVSASAQQAELVQ